LMAGYGYSWGFGATRVSAEVLGGYAFTTFKITSAANDAYIGRLGARSLKTDASNTAVLRPGVDLWYDLGKKVGLHVDVGYMIARPTLTVTSSLGEDSRRIRADVFIFKVGAVYSIF